MYDYDVREDQSLKWWNEINERRMTATHKRLTLEFVEEHYGEDSEEFKWAEENSDKDGCLIFPIQFEVCFVCYGKGKHTNPGVDAHGITGEEFENEWSYEDRELYFSGGYDVTCNLCRGKRVVPSISDSAPENIKKMFIDDEQDEADYQRVCRAERRMGC